MVIDAVWFRTEGAWGDGADGLTPDCANTASGESRTVSTLPAAKLRATIGRRLGKRGVRRGEGNRDVGIVRSAPFRCSNVKSTSRARRNDERERAHLQSKPRRETSQKQTGRRLKNVRVRTRQENGNRRGGSVTCATATVRAGSTAQYSTPMPERATCDGATLARMSMRRCMFT